MQYNLVPADGRCRSSAEKVTAGLAESNGRLPLGGWLKVTCGLTACTPGLASGTTLGNEYGKTSPFYLFTIERSMFGGDAALYQITETTC